MTRVAHCATISARILPNAGACMSSLIEAQVPDIGNYHDVPVIELLVKPGDTVTRDRVW